MTETKNAEGARAAMVISDRSSGRDNNFNLLRMIAATGVLVSHAYPISLGRGYSDPIAPFLKGTTLGTVSVYVFFAISGFFIARSFAGRTSLSSFLRARALRIFPGLMVVLALIVVAAAWLTTANAVSFWAAVPEYYLRNVTLFFLQNNLPGVFEMNPYSPAINGSLWTLNYEVLCYLGVVLAGFLGISAAPRRFALALVLFAIAYGLVEVAVSSTRISNLMELGLPFAIGMSFWVWRAHIPLSPALAVALGLAAAVTHPTAVFVPVFTLALSYAVFVIGYARIPGIGAYNRFGDYSYGTYIYAFPVQQVCAASGVTSPELNIALALPPTILLAMLSWHFVEAPALRSKARPRRVESAEQFEISRRGA